MFGYARALARGSWILSLTFLGSGIVLAARLLGPLAPELYSRTRKTAVRIWAKAFCRTLGMRVTVRGNRPKGRFLLVSNHLSYTDIPLLVAQVDGTFVAKADLGDWPFLGRMFRIAGTIFIDRGRKRDLLRVMEAITAVLRRDEGVIVFAEGTTGRGDEILRLKPSLLELPARDAEPVHYATISYSTPPGAPPSPDIVGWWDDTPFAQHFLRLLTLPRFEATLVFGDEPVVDRDRKALAERLRAAMLGSFRPADASSR